MNQELTVSSNIVDYLVNELPVYKKCQVLDCIEYLEQNYFALDDKRKFVEAIFNKIDKIEDHQKRGFIEEILSMCLTQRSKIFKTNEVVSEEFLLTLNTMDRIFFDPFLNEKEINKLKNKYDFEIYNSNSFGNPSPFERLKHLPTFFYLESDRKYDLNQILEPFLREEKKLEVIDPYLPNRIASHHLIRLLEKNKGKTFILTFLKKDIYPNQSDFDKFYIRINLLNEQGFEIKMNFLFKKKHKERYILTDNFQIYLPGGFDCLDLEGKPKIQDSKNERFQIRIEKRLKTEGL